MQNPQHRSTPAEAPITGFSALELAQTHVEDFGVSGPEQVEEIEQALILAAEYLHESGHSLAWDELTPADFFARVAFMSEREQVVIAQILMGFYVWLACRHLTPADASLDILDRLVGVFPHVADLEFLRRHAQPLLSHLAKMERLN